MNVRSIILHSDGLTSKEAKRIPFDDDFDIVTMLLFSAFWYWLIFCNSHHISISTCRECSRDQLSKCSPQNPPPGGSLTSCSGCRSCIKVMQMQVISSCIIIQFHCMRFTCPCRGGPWGHRRGHSPSCVSDEKEFILSSHPHPQPLISSSPAGSGSACASPPSPSPCPPPPPPTSPLSTKTSAFVFFLWNGKL